MIFITYKNGQDPEQKKRVGHAHHFHCTVLEVDEFRRVAKVDKDDKQVDQEENGGLEH